MATKFGCVMLDKCLDLQDKGEDHYLKEAQGTMLDKILFNAFDSSFDTHSEVFFKDMIQHFFTVKLLEKAYEKSRNDKQRSKII